MAETISIPPSNLLIDADNPRLLQPSTGQREAQRALAEHQKRKLLMLAKSIVQKGLDKSNLPIVMPANDDLKRYFVLEGNRRLTALRALENPDSLVGAVDVATLNDLRELSRAYQAAPIELVQCLAVKNREEANYWIELRHTGENQGAGIVAWGADESARFRARSGLLEIHSQALDFLELHGHLTPAKRAQVPVSSFKRLLGTPEVRAKVGIGLQNGTLQYLAEPKHIAKALLHIVDDLASSITRTKHIYSREQRIDYANKLPAEVVVKPTLKNGRALLSGKKSNTFPKPKLVRVREYLIPRDCILLITDARICEIERELRYLNLESYTNAVSVLFRVFVELSIDAYIVSKSLPASEDFVLAKKMEIVLNDLLTKQKITRSQAAPVRRAMVKDSFLAPSLMMLNKYVHNQNVFPAPSDLRAHWNSLQPFMTAVWSP